MPSNFSFFFTADLHGNMLQYIAALSAVEEMGLDALVIGGDIAPKEGNPEEGHHWTPNHSTRNPAAQKRFYETQMIPLLEAFRSETDAQVYLMMGNDDFRVNMPVLEAVDGEVLNLIGGQAHNLPGGIHLVGSEFVNITPFEGKDWEMWDTKDCETDPRYILQGYTTVPTPHSGEQVQEYHRINYENVPKTDSLEAYLERTILPQSDPKRTIYAFHAPPRETNLDRLMDMTPVGSEAIRRFFEKHNALLGLHGHIHETAIASGNQQDRVGGTLVVGAANEPFITPGVSWGGYNRRLSGAIIGTQEGGFLDVETGYMDLAEMGDIIPERIKPFLPEDSPI